MVTRMKEAVEAEVVRRRTWEVVAVAAGVHHRTLVGVGEADRHRDRAEAVARPSLSGQHNRCRPLGSDH